MDAPTRTDDGGVKGERMLSEESRSRLPGATLDAAGGGPATGDRR